MSAIKSFYIASSISNVEEVRLLARDLSLKGLRQTYDWTTHGPVAAESGSTIAKIAKNEADGVIESDLFIAALPGGNGTHVEIGIAIATAELLNKPKIIVWAKDKEAVVRDGKVTSFYYHPRVEFVLGDMDKLKERIEAVTGQEVSE